MSFILDALKKSEAERQRQAGPTLLEVRVTTPQRRYPLWALIVAALLAINLGVLMAFLLRAPATPPGAVANTAATANPAPAAAAVDVHTPPAAPVSPPVSPPVSLPSNAENPADDAPAVPATGGSVRVSRDTDMSNLPSASELGSDVPELRLDLHVYADAAADRYALINMHKVREGDMLAEGPRVLAITRDGVALQFHGQDFMLRPQ